MERYFGFLKEIKPQFRTLKFPIDWLLLALISLLVQAFWASRLDHPAYMDAYYYTTNGQRLAAGEGWTETIIWQYLDEPTSVPAPSHTYWMPLTSLLTAAGYRLSDTFRGAQLPFWLMTGLLPLLSYTISRHLSGERWQAWTAALFTAAGGFFAVNWNQPETFAPFAWAGGLCLLFLALAQQQLRPHYWLLAGLTAGLAHLTRADGLLLLVVAFLLLASQAIPNPQSKISNLLLHTLWLLAGYLLITAGWFWHTNQVIGRPLSTVGTQTLFLTTYDDLFAYGRSFNLSSYLAWGWANIARSKLEALWLAGQTFIAVFGLIFLTPFILMAWLRLARRPATNLFLRPLTYYTLFLLIAMSLLFTFPGQRGGLFHSGAALWPWFMALAPAGLSLAVDWTAARLPHWQPERAKRTFAALFVIIAFLLSFVIGLGRLQPDPTAAAYQDMAAHLPPTAVVMVGDPPGFYYHTGRSALSVPNEPLDVLLQVAGRYHATHLLIDDNHPVPLHDLYTGAASSPHLSPIYTFTLDEETFKLYAIEAAE